MDPEPTTEASHAPGERTRLDSWKEIAAYLRRDITTARRWEKREGLPVHRHLHERRDSVYAFPAEIDAWWRGRRDHLVERVGDGTVGPTTGPLARPMETPRSDRPSTRIWWLPAAFAAVAVVPAAFVVADVWTSTNDRPAELRFSEFPPAGSVFETLALSPDARQLAYTASHGSGGGPLLWVRPLDATAAHLLPDTEGAALPFWSPSGDALGFFAAGKLWVVSLTDDTPRALADAPHGRGGSWSPNGTIVFSSDREAPLSRVLAAGGAVSVVTALSPGERGHLWPHFLPDGRHFLYLADSSEPEHHNLFVGDLETATRKPLVARASSNAMYGADGHLFFAQGRDLAARAFDAERLAFRGTDEAIIDRVSRHQEFEHLMQFSVARAPVIAYRRMQSPASTLVWRDRRQVLQTITTEPAEYFEPALAPDERSVAIGLFDPRPSPRFGYGLADIRSDVVLLDPASGASTTLTAAAGADWGPVWSPDGTRLVYSSNGRDRTLQLYQRSLDPVRPEEVLLETKGMNPVAQSWSADGRYVLYAAFDPATRTDLWVLPMSGDARTPRPLLNAAYNEMQGQISPDGRWFAYSSDEADRLDVYVQSFPVPGVKFHVSPGGGADPRWRPDGQELFYLGNDRRLMAVGVKLDGGFEHGTPRPLFDTGLPPWWYEARNVYDVARDGRFLFVKPAEDDRVLPVTMVVNPAALIRR